MAYATPSHDEESPKEWSTPNERRVLFVTAESSFEYTDVIFDIVYPAVGNSWGDLLIHAVDELDLIGTISSKPLWIHDHGGIRKFHTGGSTCRWDSFQCGWAIARPGFGEKEIESRVREMEMYLTGEVYGVVIHKKHEDGSWEPFDSCWGVYDDSVGLDDCFRVAIDMGFPFSEKSEDEIPRSDA